jgi:Flp pilus assembly protein TadG
MRYRRSIRLSRLGNERGQAMVEFSLVLLLLVIVLFGIIEVGRLALTYTALADAARAGARYAIVHGGASSSPSGNGNAAAVKTQVTNITNYAGLSGVIVTVSYLPMTGDPNGNLTGDPVTVTASYAYAPIILLSPFAPLNVTLSSTSQGMICY